MHEDLCHYGLDGIVVATKADKISRNQMQKQIRMIRETLQLAPETPVVPVSALKRTGADVLLEEMEQFL